MKAIIPLIFVCVLVSVGFARAETDSEPKPSQPIDDLRAQLEGILTETHTPGMSIAIVRRDGPDFVAGLGKADIASDRAATAETLFRIGSVSKAFTSLAILQLVREGKLSLEDPVHRLVPEVWFENRWEASDPVRVVDLLEHTTGWDDMHLREYAEDDATIGLREALDYDHSSRTSRWPPGTRMAYCNSGPAVAAYIVEKLTGQRFEDYVARNLFSPIGMRAATFFQPDAAQAATLYRIDGHTPLPYDNLLYRPAGAINASADDMAAYLRFYLDRGSTNGTQVVLSADLDRMEVPTRTWAAKDGLTIGYGLGNYVSIYDGFVYHGHDGAVGGDLTELAYLPEIGVGYFYSINTANGAAFGRIGKAIRDYVTHGLQKPAIPAPAALPADAETYAGWYEPDSPRMELFHFLERLAGLARIRFEDGKLLLAYFRGDDQVFLPVIGKQFRREAGDPVATFELLTPNDEGQFAYVQFRGFSNTLKRIPTWLAVGEICLAAWVALAMASIVLYAPFWLFGGLFRRRRRPQERWIRIWPLIAVSSLIAEQLVVGPLAGTDAIGHFGHLTAWSGAVFLSTVMFAVASCASAVALWRARGPEIRRVVRYHSVAVTSALLINAAYLVYWGLIGFRTWA